MMHFGSRSFSAASYLVEFIFGRIHMMKHGQTAELTACLFMVGQDSHRNWVAQNQSKTRGGLFGDRIDALRFVRSENANRTQAYIAVNEIFELEMARTTRAV
jgi:hypothetical protein